ncbi:MAG: hypothetical protein D6679_01040 [Candidatus Hydrogenedentota bacterium]|nr:MAG: hypothetical protein D6679_01040 [Candidatus Hydrogenedentota bacterium]
MIFIRRNGTREKRDAGAEERTTEHTEKERQKAKVKRKYGAPTLLSAKRRSRESVTFGKNTKNGKRKTINEEEKAWYVARGIFVRAGYR